MSLSNIYFILVRPQMGENIGSVARAIKNFNIKYLRIVNPRCNWPSQKALATSVGAKDVLKSAKIYDSVKKSIKDLDIIFASTSRIRKVNKKVISIFDLKKKLQINKKLEYFLVLKLQAYLTMKLIVQIIWWKFLLIINLVP